MYAVCELIQEETRNLHVRVFQEKKDAISYAIEQSTSYGWACDFTEDDNETNSSNKRKIFNLFVET